MIQINTLHSLSSVEDIYYITEDFDVINKKTGIPKGTIYHYVYNKPSRKNKYDVESIKKVMQGQQTIETISNAKDC